MTVKHLIGLCTLWAGWMVALDTVASPPNTQHNSPQHNIVGREQDNTNTLARFGTSLVVPNKDFPNNVLATNAILLAQDPLPDPPLSTSNKISSEKPAPSLGTPPLVPKEGVMSFTMGGHCSPECRPWAVARGVMAKTTPDQFKLFAQSHPELVGVVLDSPGGDLGAAIRLGALIRQAGLNTRVDKDGRCWSACPYAFLGGVARTIDADTVLGVHQFVAQNPEDVAGGVAVAQNAMSELAQYAKDMGASGKMVALGAVVDNNQLRLLNRAEAQSLNIDNSSPPQGSWNIHTVDDVAVMRAEQQQPNSDRRVLWQIAQATAQERTRTPTQLWMIGVVDGLGIAPLSGLTDMELCQQYQGHIVGQCVAVAETSSWSNIPNVPAGRMLWARVSHQAVVRFAQRNTQADHLVLRLNNRTDGQTSVVQLIMPMAGWKTTMALWAPTVQR